MKMREALWIGIGRSGCPSPLPPNRTGGFPASGFPVGGFTAERIDRSEPEQCGETARAQPGQRRLPGIPKGIVNMASEVIEGARPVALATLVPGRLARRHSRRCRLPRFPLWSSTFLRPFAPDPLQILLRSYGRSDSCPSPSWTLSLNACSTYGQGSLIHALGLPTILSPTTCVGSALPGHVTHRQVEARLLLHGTTPNENSRLRQSSAGSPPDAGRIEFRFLPHAGEVLRTGRSPPAAPHPVSPRRSCSRLQATLTWRELSSLRPSALSGAHCGSSSYRFPPSIHTANVQGAAEEER
jgi:hypothetical protein